MKYKQVQLHNVAEVTSIEGRDGVLLQRVPESVRIQLNESSQGKMLDPAGVEIRFITDGAKVRLTLSTLDGVCELWPFWGGFQSAATYRVGSEPTVIELEYPQQLASADPSHWQHIPFSHRTWRLLAYGRPLIFHGIEGDGVRPPETGDVPQRRMIVYGTSITQGAHASGPHLTYAALLARRLRADICNLGSSGSALCEAAMADYIAQRQDWDAAVLCLSVNMVGAGFTVQQFEERIAYMIRTIAAGRPARKVFCISILPHHRDFLPAGSSSEQAERAKRFRQTLREVTERLQLPQVTFVEGAELLTQPEGLSTDLIHPGDIGMMEIAEKLSARIAYSMGW